MYCSVIYNFSGESWFIGQCFHNWHVIQEWVKHHFDSVEDIILTLTNKTFKYFIL